MEKRQGFSAPAQPSAGQGHCVRPGRLKQLPGHSLPPNLFSTKKPGVLTHNSDHMTQQLKPLHWLTEVLEWILASFLCYFAWPGLCKPLQLRLTPLCFQYTVLQPHWPSVIPHVDKTCPLFQKVIQPLYWLQLFKRILLTGFSGFYESDFPTRMWAPRGQGSRFFVCPILYGVLKHNRCTINTSWMKAGTPIQQIFQDLMND